MITRCYCWYPEIKDTLNLYICTEVLLLWLYSVSSDPEVIIVWLSLLLCRMSRVSNMSLLFLCLFCPFWSVTGQRGRCSRQWECLKHPSSMANMKQDRWGFSHTHTPVLSKASSRSWCRVASCINSKICYGKSRKWSIISTHYLIPPIFWNELTCKQVIFLLYAIYC